ncbi:unnamed protein product [Symbiodinium sp. KB8]|nr:unnamed protein product [Symbiodinium sp. KB8]
MHAAGGLSPRDWGSVLHGGSVVVSSTGINSVINTRHAAGGSMVSSSSCSSYPTGALQTPELLDSTRDLIAFSDTITRHFHVVMSCLAQNDQDLRTGADMVHVLVVGLVGAAQVVASKLSTTAHSALDKLPTLLWAVRGHESADLGPCMLELHESLASLRKEAQGVRTDYIDLLKQVQYLGHCTQVTMDLVIISSLPEPAQDENGILECHADLSSQLTEAQTESKKYLELTLLHLDSMCQILEECSDFWLMLHNAELKLRKLEKESKAFCDGQGSEPFLSIHHLNGGKAALQSFCEHVRSFCGVYSGIPTASLKSLPPVALNCQR